MTIDDPQMEIARFLRRLQWAALAAAAVWLLWLLGPVLTPFVCAALLAWAGDPLVDRLQARGWKRGWGVTVVFAVGVLVLLLVLVLLVPALQDQFVRLANLLPRAQTWLFGAVLPWIQRRTGVEVSSYLDLSHVWAWLRGNWDQAGGVARTLLAYISRSGFAIFGWVTNLVLIPVITFFFLRDFDLLVGRMAAIVPRDRIATVTRLANESSEVLGGFLRGQLLVMLILGVLYGLGLWAVGLDLGILIGLAAGLLTFVPYLGPTTGVLMGLVAAAVQYGDLKHLLGVGIVFGIGQVVESYFLTPKLVGDRIGLHPVAVIFAVLAGGALFGFLGMLLALPAAAVANVLLRYAHERYTQSALYAGEKQESAILLDARAEPPPRPGPTEGA
ncbi:MAG: AI-2E family transporter [Pseudoxanthomonas sp.]